MTIKLLVLKSGEELISDVAEMSVPGETMMINELWVTF